MLMNDSLKEGFKIQGKVRWIKHEHRSWLMRQLFGPGKVIEVSEWKKNLIVFSTNHGLDLILRRLASDNTYSLNITYADIGTSSTAPAITDTALTAAVARAPIALANVSGSTVALRFFFADGGLANGTYTEFGMFVDGTSSTGTGQMFNHVLFSSSLVKASLQDVTVEVDVSVA